MRTNNKSYVLMSVLFSSLPTLSHNLNPPDIWPELRSFEDLRYSRLHYSGESVIVRLWRPILTEVSLVLLRLGRGGTVSSSCIQGTSPLSHCTLDLLNIWLDFPSSITLLELVFPVLHTCLGRWLVITGVKLWQGIYQLSHYLNFVHIVRICSLVETHTA